MGLMIQLFCVDGINIQVRTPWRVPEPYYYMPIPAKFERWAATVPKELPRPSYNIRKFEYSFLAGAMPIYFEVRP